MSLEALRKEIHQEAEREKKKRLDAAKAEAAALLRKAEEEAVAFLEKARREAEEEAKGLQLIISAARLESKKKIAEARDTLVDRELAEAKNLAMEFSSDQAYPKWLKKAVEQSIRQIGAGAKVFARKKDFKLLKKLGYEAEPFDCGGGVIVTTPDGRIRVNSTLEVVFESKQDLLRQKIFEEL